MSFWKKLIGGTSKPQHGGSGDDLAASIPDPVMDFEQAMANATIYAMQSEIDDSRIRFIQSAGRETGIWVSKFPGNTTKRALLLMFCEWHKNERAKETILNDKYRIVKNQEKGGYDVLFRS